MTYKSVTTFSLANFSLQKQLIHISSMEDGKQKQDLLGKTFSDFAILQNQVLVDSIDQIETPNGVVTEFGFIKEWVDNCDQQSVATIRKKMDEKKAKKTKKTKKGKRQSHKTKKAFAPRRRASCSCCSRGLA